MRDILSTRSVTTRKPHRCFGCARTIPAGTMMRIIVQVDSGEFDRMYWCPVCSEWCDRYAVSGDEFMEGELRREAPEEFEELRREVEGK